MSHAYCAGCGTARTGELGFCTNCGRPFDPVPAAPHPGAPAAPAPVPSAMVPPQPVAPQPLAPQPLAPVAPDPGRSSRGGRRRGLVIGICALVIAVAAAGFVGWRIFGSSSSSTGADTPEQAVRELVDAVIDQDGVAALKLIAPGETVDLDSVYRSAQDRLKKEGLTDGDTVTDAVTLDVDDLELDTEDLGDHAARVTVTGGTYRVSWDPDELPERLDSLKDDFPSESDSGDLEELLYDGYYEHHFGAITVKVDGRWYVTLIGSYLDAFSPEFEEEDLSPADYTALDERLDPIVGKTPEDVIDNLVAAINDQDADALLANLPADLVLGARPFTRTAESALRREGVQVKVSASDLDLETEDIGGGRLKVTIDGGRFEGDVSADDDPGARGDITIDGDCAYGSGTDRGSGYDEYYDYYDEDDTESFEECLGSYSDFGDLGVRDAYVVMRKVSGGYQLDPMGTVSVYAQKAIKELPSSLIDEWIEDIDDAFYDDEY